MRAPRKTKPSSADEMARVLRIADVLDEELRRRWAYMEAPERLRAAILAVADRIASRTED